MLSASLALVQRDQHRHRWVERDLHQDVVEFVVIEPEHVQVKRDADPRQHVFENVMDIVAPDIKQMKVLAGAGRVDFFWVYGCKSSRSNRCRLTAGLSMTLVTVDLGGSIAASGVVATKTMGVGAVHGRRRCWRRCGSGRRCRLCGCCSCRIRPRPRSPGSRSGFLRRLLCGFLCGCFFRHGATPFKAALRLEAEPGARQFIIACLHNASASETIGGDSSPKGVTASPCCCPG